MATKAELEAELAALKQQMGLDEAAPGAEGDAADTAADPAMMQDRSAFEEVLRAHGVSASDIESLWGQLSKELGDLPRNKPLLTTLGAFALGFALGRITR